LQAELIEPLSLSEVCDFLATDTALSLGDFVPLLVILGLFEFKFSF
jgi:hypothetical protein